MVPDGVLDGLGCLRLSAADVRRDEPAPPSWHAPEQAVPFAPRGELGGGGPRQAIRDSVAGGRLNIGSHLWVEDRHARAERLTGKPPIACSRFRRTAAVLEPPRLGPPRQPRALARNVTSIDPRPDHPAARR